MYLNLPPNVSHDYLGMDYLGMVLCIRSLKSVASYSVENTTSDFVWRGGFFSVGAISLMVIVPRTTFSLEDGDDGIKLNARGDAKVYGIHLLYKTLPLLMKI